MTDIRTLVSIMREQEKAATAEKAAFDTWSDQDVRKMLSNDESDRLLRGEHSTLSAAERAEVTRLAKLAAEESQP